MTEQKQIPEKDREMIDIGAFCFGGVIGWITSVSFHSQSVHGLKDIAVIIGAVGGAAVVQLFPGHTTRFANYSLGLASGFGFHFLLAWFAFDGRVVPFGTPAIQDKPAAVKQLDPAAK